jgi:hypothetical protein
MNKLFVPYELAILAKEKGFDEPCLAYYDLEDSNNLKPIPMFNEINGFNSNSNKLMISAPLYQQLIIWLMQNKGLELSIMRGHNPENYYSIVGSIKGVNDYKHYPPMWGDSWEEAANKSLEEAFKLI